jgi:glyoxylase-like metal-dependent hydrolase (beta-lactamase superfamily II)
LFTGDHLWWEPETGQLESPRQLVWNGTALHHSIEKLAHHRFEWVLAGHGGRINLPLEKMQASLRDLAERRRRRAE